MAACILACEPGIAAGHALAGRSVGEVLDELRGQGLTFIYNTALVPPTLRIQQEPRASGGIALAREILAPHALQISAAAPGVYAVVRARPEEQASERAPLTAPQSDAPIEEVIVNTSRYMLLATPGVSSAFLAQGDIQNMPRLADEPLRAAQRLPGVASNGFSSIGSVRGGEPNETAIVLDGLRLYEPFHLKNFMSPVSLLDSRSISGMHVYSGGFPVVYGDRMSAIVDAQTVRPEQARYYELFLSLFHASGLASSEFAEGRGHALLSARRSNVGDLSRYSEHDFGEPQYADGLIRLDYEFDDKTRAAFDTLLSRDRVTAVRDGGSERAEAEYRNAYAWATLERDWSERWSSRLILSLTDIDNERTGEVNNPGQRTGSVEDLRRFHVVGLRVENELDATLLDQRFGAEVRRLWGRYDYESDVLFEPGFPLSDSPGAREQASAHPRPHGFETSAYWDGRMELASAWTVQAGLRFDTQTYDGSDDAAQWSPRISVLYALQDRTHLRASWGRFYQAQGINELQVEDGVQQFYQPQHADHAILGLDHEFAPGWDLRFELYQKEYRKLRPRFENLLNPLVLLPETEIDRVMIAPDSARARGVELLLRAEPWTGWNAWFGYTWSRVEDRIDGRDVLRSWDQTHAFNVGVSWVRGPWAATMTNSYHTGWPITTLTQATDPGGATRIEFGARNAARTDFYNSLDVRVTRTFVLPHGALDVFVEASNALSRENPCCIDYDISTDAAGNVRLEQETDSWLPLVPSIGVLWRL
jgi:hypothetical protein